MEQQPENSAQSFELPDGFGSVSCVIRAHWYLNDIGVDFDVDAQFAAIRHLLDQNKTAENELSSQYKQTEQGVGDHVGEMLADLAHDSIFQGAAHSMAAVGMLAPLLETVFYQCFRGIGSKWSTGNIPTGEHDRWRAAHAIQWDCHKVIDKEGSHTNLVEGILQLAEAIHLRSRLPADIKKTLSALFEYRNKMFHRGFEWPVEERIKFQERIHEWPKTWFATATVGGKPWIFYLTDEFIEHCLLTADQVLTAFGEFVRDDLRAKSGPPGK